MRNGRYADDGRVQEFATAVNRGLRAVARASVLVPLSDYLAPGQVMPNDGVADAAALINSALNDLLTKANGDRPFGPARYVLSLGPGRFRITAPLQPYSPTGTKKHIGLRGAGKHQTFILPEGPTTAIHMTSPSDTSKVAAENCYFGDFTIDMTAATLGPNGESRKGFVGRGWMDCEFDHVVVKNSPASAFGVDFPIRTTFTECGVDGTGLGVDGPLDMTNGVIDAAKYHSGFGIGVGVFPNESALFDGCWATNCYRGGFFLEPFENSGATAYRDGVYRFTNCRAWRNRIGFSNVGGSGASLVNCELSDNTVAGYYGGVSAGVTAIASCTTTMENCQILRNGYGIYATGNPFAANRAPAFFRDVLGGYRIINSRIEDNTLGGLVAEGFRRIWAGGLTIRGNHFRRNGRGGVTLRKAIENTRDVIIENNMFDGNDDYGISLQLALAAPKITGNIFVNTDGGAVQKDGIIWHRAEPVSVPMVRDNTFRQMVRSMVNAVRLDSTYISGNRDVSATDAGTLRTYSENFFGGPVGGAVWPGGSWTKSPAGVADNWTRGQGGIQPAAVGRSLVYKSMPSAAAYVEVDISPSFSGDLAKSEMLGVMLALDSGGSQTAIIAGINGADTAFGVRSNYAVWVLVAGIPALVWESGVPATEGHAIALARLANSTITDVFIDGALVYSVDIPTVPASALYGVFTAGQATGQDRVLAMVRAMPYVSNTPPVLVRNMGTNPSFEVPGGFSLQVGTGGTATDSRPGDAPNAHGGSYSHLVTWTTATTDPAGGGGNISAIEDVTVGTVYTLSVWVKSSVARQYRPSVNYYAGSGATGTYVGYKQGEYVSVPANTWTRLSVVTDPIPSGAVSVRLGVSAAALSANTPNFEVGDTLRFDDYMCTEGETLYEFFDGYRNGGAWVGTANASASTKMID